MSTRRKPLPSLKYSTFIFGLCICCIGCMDGIFQSPLLFVMNRRNMKEGVESVTDKQQEQEIRKIINSTMEYRIHSTRAQCKGHDLKPNPRAMIFPVYNVTTTSISTLSKTYSRTGLMTHRNNKDTTTLTSIQQNHIPCDMLVIDDKLKWCPNAKAGTSTIYGILRDLGIRLSPIDDDLENLSEKDNPMEDVTTIMAESSAEERCFHDCPSSAWRKIQPNDSSSDSKKRRLDQKAKAQKENEIAEQVMKAPSFTIVRNPWDRMRSAYMDKIAATSNNNNNRQGVPIMSFAEFVFHVAQHKEENVHWQSYQARCLTSQDSQGRQYHYDYIIKLEDGNLFEQLKTIFTKAGLPFPNDPKSQNVVASTSTSSTSTRIEDTNNQIPREQRPLKISTSQFYQEEAEKAGISVVRLIRSVRETFHEDIQEFGYSFPV